MKRAEIQGNIIYNFPYKTPSLTSVEVPEVVGGAYPVSVDTVQLLAHRCHILQVCHSPQVSAPGNTAGPPCRPRDGLRAAVHAGPVQDKLATVTVTQTRVAGKARTWGIGSYDKLHTF